ncbi:uncharacterized protein LOC144457848 [Phascolarctos cinereus]
MDGRKERERVGVVQSAIAWQPATAAPRSAHRPASHPHPGPRAGASSRSPTGRAAPALGPQLGAHGRGEQRRAGEGASAHPAPPLRAPAPPRGSPSAGRRPDPPGGAAAASPAGGGGAAGPGRAGLAGARHGALDPAPAAPPAAASRTRGGGAGVPAGAAAAAAGAAAHDSVTRGIRQSVTWTPGPVLALQPRDQPQPASAATGPAATNGAARGPHVIASEL